MSKLKETFFEKNADIAIDQFVKYGIPASVTLAQMSLERARDKFLSTRRKQLFWHQGRFGVAGRLCYSS